MCASCTGSVPALLGERWSAGEWAVLGWLLFTGTPGGARPAARAGCIYRGS